MGYFGFKSLKRRDLTEDDLEILKILSNILADALTKNKMEREMLEANHKAQRANAAKSQFLANMSHEIRTPLNAIMGFTELTQKTDLTPIQRDHIQKIELASENLLRVINDILDVSKMESAKLILEEVPFYLLDVLYKVSHILSSSISKKRLTFIITLERDVPRALLGDSFRLEQVLLNILSNAVKFTARGGEILLHISLSEDLGDRDRLLFSVKDTGIGISKEQQSLLFQPFVQADGTTTRQYGGTGLGLTISKSLVEMMDGEMMVESELGKGSHFFFTIQLERVKEPPHSPILKLPEEYKKTKLLLLKKDSPCIDLLGEMLFSFGFQVEITSSIEVVKERLTESQRESTQDLPLVLLHEEREGFYSYGSLSKLRDTLAHQVPVITMVRDKAPLLYDDKSQDTFFYQPIHLSPVFQALEEVLKRDRSLSFSTEIPALSGARILLAEDTPLNQELVKGILEDVGIEVVIVATGEEALLEALAHKNERPYPYDVILMDLQMPIMDGFEVTERIRQEETLQDVPIIALTAHAMASDRERGLAFGMNDYLTKPIHSHDLYRALLQYIRRDEEPSHTLSPDLLEDTSASKMPEIQGLHVQEALKRLNNNKNLYRRLLQSFLKENERIVESMREATASRDRGLLLQFIHTLKGSLGTIGAYELEEEALHLEESIGEGHVKERDLDRFEQKFSQWIASLKEYVEGEIEEGESRPLREREVDVDELQESLEELDRMLAMGRFAAKDHFDKLKELLEGSGVCEELNALERHIESFAMFDARHALQQLKAKLPLF